MQQKLTIAIADDHTIIRMGLKYSILEHFTATVYEASNGDDLISVVKEHAPQVVIMDINMPATDPNGTLHNILIARPNTLVLVFSVNKEEVYGKLYMKAGAMGYIQKDASDREIISAIKTVLEGKLYMKKEMRSYYLGGEEGKLQPSTSPYSVLSKKETEVLEFLQRGNTVVTIARLMNLSPSTVGTHKAKILAKLKMENIFELKDFIRLYPLN